MIAMISKAIQHILDVDAAGGGVTVAAQMQLGRMTAKPGPVFAQPPARADVREARDQHRRGHSDQTRHDHAGQQQPEPRRGTRRAARSPAQRDQEDGEHGFQRASDPDHDRQRDVSDADGRPGRADARDGQQQEQHGQRGAGG